MGQKEEMRLDNSSKIPKFQAEKKLEYRNPVQYDAGKQYSEQPALWQVFIKQNDIIAEIQVCLLMVILGQGTSSHMIHNGVMAIHNSMAHILNPPAKVDLLHMCKKEGIQSPA